MASTRATSATSHRPGRATLVVVGIGLLIGADALGAGGPRPDRSREGLTLDKALQPLRLLRPKYTRTLARARTFEAVVRNLDRLGERRGRRVEGVILDVDEAIAPHHGRILDDNLAAIRHLQRAGIKVAVFSNAKRDARLDVVAEMGIPIVTHLSSGRAVPGKPRPEGFLEAARVLGLDPRALIMVGDNYLTDAGSLRAGIDFVRLEPVPTAEQNPSLSRRIQTRLRALYDRIARFHDRFRQRPALWLQ